MRIWIDTDVGTNPDDGVALLLALAHPDLEVVGVSTVSGDTAIRARVARAYVPDRGVPVIAGAARPRAGGPEPRWMGHEGEGPLGEPGPTMEAAGLEHAVREAGPDALIALGPLTNVAMLIEAGAAPDVIVAMAGLTAPVFHRGREVTEDHNTASDPGAAAVVHARAGDLLTVPLDVTVRMRLGDRDAAVLAAHHPRLGHEIAEWLTREDAVVVHDALVVLAAVPHEHGRIGLAIEATEAIGPPRRRVTAVDGASATRRVVDLVRTRRSPGDAGPPGLREGG